MHRPRSEKQQMPTLGNHVTGLVPTEREIRRTQQENHIKGVFVCHIGLFANFASMCWFVILVCLLALHRLMCIGFRFQLMYIEYVFSARPGETNKAYIRDRLEFMFAVMCCKPGDSNNPNGLPLPVFTRANWEWFFPLFAQR